MINQKIKPKEITLDNDIDIHIAHFRFWDVNSVIKDWGFEQTTNFSDVFAGTHFIVCCGDILVKVDAADYPEIERRII